MTTKRQWPDDFINKIICGDCLEVMKDMPDKCVDLVLTDPPYGLGFDYGKYWKDTEKNVQNLIKKFIPEILRLSKRALITCSHHNLWMYPQPDWVLSWVNMAGSSRNSWGFTCWRPILAYGKDPFLAAGLGARHDVIQHNEASDKHVDHPCPKPDGFWEKLLFRGSIKEGDVILDPFLGSGTTAQVCKLTHRHFIGIEINPDYCKIAEERLAQGVL